ncbi:MAG: hypothetical protein OXG35_32570 [Acidobacteria bacterium]|nr:hypothetical protein [Acidobacteriota bacterium]
MYRRLAALTALIALAAVRVGGEGAHAQTSGTNEQLLSNYVTGGASNSLPRAQQITTGAADATLAHVNLRVAFGSGSVTVAIWSDSSGEPGSELHALTAPADLSSGKRTFTAPANTVLTGGTTYWVVISHGLASPNAIGTTNVDFSTLHGWSSGATRVWNINTDQWDASTTRPSIEVWAAVHSGVPHQPDPVPDEDSSDSFTSPAEYDPIPPCTEEQRQWRQSYRGEVSPHRCQGGYYHPIEMYPSSDPCDQPWEVPGSYRRDRGCLSR